MPTRRRASGHGRRAKRKTITSIKSLPPVPPAASASFSKKAKPRWVTGEPVAYLPDQTEFRPQDTIGHLARRPLGFLPPRQAHAFHHRMGLSDAASVAALRCAANFSSWASKNSTSKESPTARSRRARMASITTTGVIENDFAQMAAHGINAVRIPHTVPPRSLLDAAAAPRPAGSWSASPPSNIVGYLIDRKKRRRGNRASGLGRKSHAARVIPRCSAMRSGTKSPRRSCVISGAAASSAFCIASIAQ